MELHNDLLDLAIRLAAPPASALVSAPLAGAAVAPPTAAAIAVPPIPPISEAESRRAISTAYYALFHLLIHASTTRGVGTAALRPYVARNFEHRSMLAICKKYAGLAIDTAGQPVSLEIQRIAGAFVQLQNARHKADYNVKDTVTPAEAQIFVQMARDAFTDWGAAAANPAADVYLTELLVGGVKER